MVASVSFPSSPRGFVPLPHAVLLDHRLSRGARLLWGVLKRHARQCSTCWPGYASLCRDLSACEDTVRRWMRELIALGLVRQERRGQGRTNLYTLECSAPPSNTAIAEPDFRGAQEAEDHGVELDKKEEERREDRSSIALPCNESRDAERPADLADSSRLPRRPARSDDPDRPTIGRLMRDISREMNDLAALPASISRAVNLYRRSGVSLDDFLDAMQTARAITQEHSGGIRALHPVGDGRKAKMSYFFAVIEDRLGLRDFATAGRNSGKKWGATRPAVHTVRIIPLAATPARQYSRIAESEIGRPLAWPRELTEIGIPDVPSFIRLTGRGPFLDPAESVACAREHFARRDRR